MLGRRGRKERKRLMALLLAGAMVLSGMGISPISVQAEETEPVVEQVSETVSDGNAERAREVLGEEEGIAAASTTQDANAAMAAAQSGTEKDLYELDLSKGLTAGTTYDGGISVLETMSFKSGSASLDGVKYTGCVQGDNSPNPNKGKIPTSGAAVRLEAEKDGRIKVVFKAKGKDIYFLQDVDGKPQGIETFKAGADLIVGDHPHCLQGVTYCGNTPVLYSLGNFWFNSKTLDTGLLKVSIGQDGMKSLQFIPAIQSDCRVKMVYDSEKERILSYLRSLSPGVQIDSDGYISQNGS